MTTPDYLLSGQPTELERLRLQAIVWQPAGERLLAELPGGEGRRVADIGCGVMGWLRILSKWVGPNGSVTGADVDPKMLERAGELVSNEQLGNVQLVEDDLFASKLEPGSFDLVHSRFQIAPLGKADEQVAAYVRLLRPGGTLVLEDPDVSTWHFNPPAPAAERLIELILQAFRAAGGNLDSGRTLRGHLARVGASPTMRTEVVALNPGHPYLRLPLQFSVSLEKRILAQISQQELERLRTEAEAELADPQRWGTTWTLVQAWAAIPD